MVNELRLRVMLGTLTAVLPLTALCTWLGGGPSGLAVLAAGVLTLGNFIWMMRHLPAAGSIHDRRPGVGWALAAVARFTVVAAVVVALLVSGWVHPLVLVSGLTVLPCVLVAAGLQLARRGMGDR